VRWGGEIRPPAPFRSRIASPTTWRRRAPASRAPGAQDPRPPSRAGPRTGGAREQTGRALKLPARPPGNISVTWLRAPAGDERDGRRPCLDSPRSVRSCLSFGHGKPSWNPTNCRCGSARRWIRVVLSLSERQHTSLRPCSFVDPRRPGGREYKILKSSTLRWFCQLNLEDLTIKKSGQNGNFRSSRESHCPGRSLKLFFEPELPKGDFSGGF